MGAKGGVAGLAALVLLLPAHAAAPPRVERIALVAAGDVHLVDPAGVARTTHLTRTPEPEAEPAVSPDGTRLAFVRSGRIVVRATTGGGNARQIGPPAVSPSWSPDGARLGVAAADGLRLVSVATGASDLLAGTTGAARPAWSPDGARVAFEREGDVWVLTLADGAVARLTDAAGLDTEPAWSPDGARIVFVSDRDGNRELYAMAADGSAQARLTTDPGDDGSPAFSPDGTRLAFVRDGAVLVAAADGSGAKRLAAGSDPAWGLIPRPRPKPKPKPRPKPKPKPKPRPDELLPDLDQRAPSNLTVGAAGGRFLLGFTSATDNVGRGPVWIRGSRPSRSVPLMTASQLVALKTGGLRVVRDVGRLRYTYAPPHLHWHLLRFQSYELRRAADFGLVVRDRKSGFCLADHYGTASHRVRGFAGPRFLGSCGQGRPDLLSVEQGTSIGYTDRYPAYFHGQNLDVTSVPAGVYVLVHRANPNRRLHERTLANNAASVRLRLAWPGGRRRAPTIRVLRSCEGSETCSAAAATR